MSSDTAWDGLRAVFLAVLMVSSVFAGTIALSAPAVADVSGINSANATDATVSGDSAQNVISANVSSNTTSENVTVSLSSLPTNVTVTSATASGSGNLTVNAVTIVDNATGDRNAQVNVNVSGSATNQTLNLTVNYDVSTSDNVSTVTATLDDTGSGGDATSSTATFNFDTAPPTVQSATTADTNDDGSVDQIAVAFSENLSASTVDAGDFRLESGSVDSVSVTGNVVSLTVSNVGDTSVTPNVTVADGSVEDTAGNQLSGSQIVEATDNADPVVTATSLNQTVINDADAPATVQVNITFSENVTGLGAGDVKLSGRSVSGSVSGDSFAGTVDIPDNNQDVKANLTVSGLSDKSGNGLVTFDQQAATIDTNAGLSLNSASTADRNDDGVVDTVRVTFNDSVNDQSVLDAIAADQFNLKSGTVQGLVQGGDNDPTVALDVTGVGDTGAVDEVTLFSDSIEDTVGNPGPSSPTGIDVADSAKPVVESLTINDTDDGSAASATVVLNESDVATDVVINATFSENLTSSDPTVELVVSGSLRTGTNDFVASSGDDTISVITASQLQDNNEDVSVFVRVTGGNDGAGNSVETFNESRITLDTLASTVNANSTAVPDEPVSGTIDLTSFFDIQDDDGGTTTYLINTSSPANYTVVENPSSFDTTQIEDTENLTVRAVDTDDVGNVDQDTTSTINVDNTAPQVTINEPAETKAEQSNGTLAVNVTVDEQNIDGNATVVLSSENNTIVYYVPVSNGDNTFQLKLNTSANATAPGADTFLPNQSATNGSFETQVVYDLSVTVNDTTGKSTTAEQPNSLFLDNTDPSGFELIAPSDPQEYKDGDGLVIAYGYTENNTGSVTVNITDKSGTVVRSITVDESQYVDDGVIKSFELDDQTINFGGLADGRYNVNVTVTDLAGNELVENTTNAPVYVNNNEGSNGKITFNSADATADLNTTTEQVTVNVTYNVSVENLNDTGDLNQIKAQLTNVAISAADGVVTATVTYYDESAGKYKKISVRNVPLGEFEGIEVVDNETVTATATASVNISDVFGDVLAEDDRVLDYTVNVNSRPDITVNADGNIVDDARTTVSVSDDSATLVSQDPVEPRIESVDVVGADTPGTQLEITFTRPVEEISDETLSPSDFGYQDVSGDGSNFIDTVDIISGKTVTVTLSEAVTAGDVGADIVSLQDGSVLQSTRGVTVSPDNGTVQETTPPAISDVQVNENATQVTISFDQPVVAGDGGNLTAANFTYVDANDAGASGIKSVEQVDDTTVVLTLNASVTSDDVSSDSIEVPAGEVFDQFGNSNDFTLSAGLNEKIKPSGVEIVAPADQLIKQNSETLQISYQYVENIPDGTDSVTVTLTGPAKVSYTISDEQYVGDGSLKTIAIALADRKLPDGTYNLKITAKDAAGNTRTDTVSDVLVINDDAPEVTDVSVRPSDNVAPDETINVSYNYQNPGVNAASVTVHIVDANDVDSFKSGDFANATFTQVTKQVDHGSGEQTVQVDLTGLDAIEDNDDYVVFVTATDQSGLTNLNMSADPIIEGTVSNDRLDVNAGQPTIESVETDAGTRTVTVTFSEEVVAADGEISLDDFAYQDVSGSGASAIESVQQVGPQTVELTLDSDVTAADLGSDLVNVRNNALKDTDGKNARQVPLDATAPADTTKPPVDLTFAERPPINAANQNAFPVTVDTGGELATVTVTFTGANGTTVSKTVTVEGQTELTFNLSTLADGEAEVTATAVDPANNTATDGPFPIDKDTVAPELQKATTNPGTATVTLTFSEAVDVSSLSPEAFTVSSPNHEVKSIQGVFANGTVVVVELNATVPPEALGAVEVSASGVTDAARNPAVGAVNLTDIDAPTIQSVTAERNSSTVIVEFNEIVTPGEDGQFTAADFQYANNNGAGVSGIESVEQISPTRIKLTLNDSLTPSDLAEDTIAPASDSVFDTVGNAAASDAVGLGFEASLTVSSDSNTVTVRVVTAQNISDAIDMLQLAEQNRELAQLEGFKLNDRFNATLNASMFTEVEPGVFEATVDVPREDVYTVSGVVSGEARTASTAVNTSVPEPTDAVILDVTSAAQLSDDRKTIRLRVLFDEPIDASQISPSDITIEGFEGDIVEVQNAGPFGAVEVIVEGDLQTGDSPQISIAGSSYTDLSGASGEAGGATVIHTEVLQLNKGINFVSVPAASGSLDVSELPLSKIDSISRYNPETGEFETFVPGAPNNPFTTLEGGVGYIIRMESGATVSINVANEPTGQGGPNAVELSEGLNLVGHYQEDQQPVRKALSSLTAGENGTFEDTVFTVLSQDEQAGGFTYESFRADEFSTMEDGEAYWVFVTDDQVYTEASFEEDE